MKKGFLRKSLSLVLTAALVVAAIPATALQTNAAVAAIPTPVYQYDFEESLAETGGEIIAEPTVIENWGSTLGAYSGDMAYDTGHDGVGKAIDLNGAYGLDLNLPSIGSTYTISLWAQPQAEFGWASSVFFVGNSADWISLAGGGLWTSINGQNSGQLNAAYEQNVWQQYIVSVNNDTAALYKNGVLLGTLTVNAGAFTGEDKALYLGVNYWDPLIDCLIDEVKVYDTAITAGQIKAMYSGAFAVAAPIASANVGDSITMEAVMPEVIEDTVIVWSSSDEAVASVDADGVVTCISDGSATITAKVMDGETEIASDSASIAIKASSTAELDAAYPNKIADFTFDDVETGFAGGEAVAVSGNEAVTLADMLITDGEGEEARTAAKFDKTTNGFLFVTKNDEAKSSLLTGAKDIKVSMDIKELNTDGKSWPFYAAPNTNEQVYWSDVYISLASFSNGWVDCERYLYTRNNGLYAAYMNAAGTWNHLDLIYGENNVAVYINNVKVNDGYNAYALQDILGENSIIQIGKANWGAGEYSNCYIDNFTISVRTDRTDLKAAIDATSTVGEEAEYTADSWKVYAEALAEAEALVVNAGALQTEVDAQTTALIDAQAALTLAEKEPDEPVPGPVPDKPEGDNVALNAEATGSFASGWISQVYGAINDDILTVPEGADANANAWGTWGNTSASEYVQYDWKSTVEVTGFDLYIWDDNPNDPYIGIETPASYVYEYIPEGSEEWTTLLTVSEDIVGGAAGELNRVVLETPVRASSIRVTLNKHMEEGSTETNAGVGLTEWIVYGVQDEVPIDKTALQAAVDAAKDLVEENYASEGWAEFQEALAAAKEVLADENAKQDAIDDAASTLRRTQNNLKEKADMSALKAAIDAAEALNADDYTAESWAEVVEELEDAKAIYEKGIARQSIVDAATEQLNKAIDGLEKDEDIPPVVTLPYVDVEETDWFYDAVYYNYVAKTMTGMDDTHFGPYGQLSRAQFALILYRIEGEPEVDTDKTFHDISGDEWYGQAVLWAAESGIVTGYQDGNYGPADNITREQMAVMMYRYAGYLGEDVTNEGDYSDFKDAASVSEFAAEAMQWAVDKGIITGKEKGTIIDPQGNTARAEAAAIIQRFME